MQTQPLNFGVGNKSKRRLDGRSSFLRQADHALMNHPLVDGFICKFGSVYGKGNEFGVVRKRWRCVGCSSSPLGEGGFVCSVCFQCVLSYVFRDAGCEGVDK